MRAINKKQTKQFFFFWWNTAMLFWREVFMTMNIDSILTRRTVSELPQHFDQNVISAHVSIVIYLRRQGTSVQTLNSLLFHILYAL